MLIIKIPWRVRDHETGMSGWKCIFFPTSNIYITLYFNVSSTLLRKNRNTDFLIRSNLIIVEHSTIIRNGKTQHWILHKEYSSPIAERLLAAPNWKNRALSTKNALESVLLPQPWCIHLLQRHIRLQVYQEPSSSRRAKGIWRRHALDGTIDEIHTS